jgi:hypothetical protein
MAAAAVAVLAAAAMAAAATAAAAMAAAVTAAAAMAAAVAMAAVLVVVVGVVGAAELVAAMAVVAAALSKEKPPPRAKAKGDIHKRADDVACTCQLSVLTALAIKAHVKCPPVLAARGGIIQSSQFAQLAPCRRSKRNRR